MSKMSELHRQQQEFLETFNPTDGKDRTMNTKQDIVIYDQNPYGKEDDLIVQPTCPECGVIIPKGQEYCEEHRWRDNRYTLEEAEANAASAQKKSCFSCYFFDPRPIPFWCPGHKEGPCEYHTPPADKE